MNRLGIDWGEKRWGISFADEVNIATPLEAIVDVDLEQKWMRLADLIKRRNVGELVVGYPYNMDGSVGFKAKEVDGFIQHLRLKFPELHIHRVDERLTSAVAGANWSEKKKRQERKSGKLDSQSAALILQDFVDQHSDDSGLLTDPDFEF